MSTDAVTILIPFRATSSHWQNIRAWQYGYLNVTYPDIPIVVADDGQRADQPFNRSKALNRARRKAHTEWLWVLDTDTAPHPDDLPLTVAAIGDHPWILPYAEVLELDECGTRFVLDGRCGNPHHWNAHTRKSPTYGLPIIHADLWDTIGGWDEQFTGWGYEDLAIHQQLTHIRPAPPPPIRWIRTLHQPRPPQPTTLTMRNAHRYNAIYLDGVNT